ncbi:siderophore-interacting protein [Paraburkholderia sp. D1E]|uniref:siderophore-interacting protein n=1 Tax=Paraburkholderia sp. D1E TaxID=3461398 RepID=UPI004046037C
MTNANEIKEPVVNRVRHELVYRLAQVVSVSAISPSLLRVTLQGESLAGFKSLSFDDHVKVLFPDSYNEEPVLPVADSQGFAYPEGTRKPTMRDFTPCRHDPVRGELDLEFAMHEAGPAIRWALQARVGQFLGIGGPRSSLIIPTDFAWNCLVGDESALPAIRRRLAEIPSNTQAFVYINIASAHAKIEFATQANVLVNWYVSTAAESDGGLLRALQEFRPPADDGFAWIAGEASLARKARECLVGRLGLHKNRVRAASYWRQGDVAIHENIDD